MGKSLLSTPAGLAWVFGESTQKKVSLYIHHNLAVSQTVVNSYAMRVQSFIAVNPSAWGDNTSHCKTRGSMSNPAVVTVASVLILSFALQKSGVVDLIGEHMLRLKGGVVVQLAALSGIVALLSAFMNNIDALALLLPVAIRISQGDFPAHLT